MDEAASFSVTLWAHSFRDNVGRSFKQSLCMSSLCDLGRYCPICEVSGWRTPKNALVSYLITHLLCRGISTCEAGCVEAKVRNFIDATGHALPWFDTDVLGPASLDIEDALSVLKRVIFCPYRSDLWILQFLLLYLTQKAESTCLLVGISPAYSWNVI